MLYICADFLSEHQVSFCSFWSETRLVWVLPQCTTVGNPFTYIPESLKSEKPPLGQVFRIKTCVGKTQWDKFTGLKTSNENTTGEKSPLGQVYRAKMFLWDRFTRQKPLFGVSLQDKKPVLGQFNGAKSPIRASLKVKNLHWDNFTGQMFQLGQVYRTKTFIKTTLQEKSLHFDKYTEQKFPLEQVYRTGTFIGAGLQSQNLH